MRNIRTRRRFKLILIFLLAVSLVLLLEARIESFAPQLKTLAESKIEEVFDKRFNISIGRLDGGILHPLTLNDCVISDEKGNELLPFVKIDDIVSNYRIWDFVFKRTIAYPRVDVHFTNKNRNVSGFVRLEGDINNAKVKGYVNLLENERVDFVGQIKNRSFELEIKPKSSIVKTRGSISDDGYIEADLKVSHLKLHGCDITCDGVLKTKGMEGELAIKNLILNYKPFSDLKSSYKISNGVLDILNLEAGNDFKAYGKVGLIDPYEIDAVLVANNTSLSRIFSSLNIIQNPAVLSGMMNGKFEFKGPVKDLKTNAHIEVRKGSLAGLDFDYLSANLRGEGPIIRIEDSRITRESGYFVLAGEIDLTKAGKGNMFEGIKMASPDTAVIWDGWNTVKMKDFEEVTMKKKMSDEFGLEYKKFVANEKIDESLRENDEYELEYNLNSNESLKFKMGQEKDFFGLEHKNKF